VTATEARVIERESRRDVIKIKIQNSLPMKHSSSELVGAT
jgi:hypothetical protein